MGYGGTTFKSMHDNDCYIRVHKAIEIKAIMQWMTNFHGQYLALRRYS